MGPVPKHLIADSPFYVASCDEGTNVARLASGIQQLWGQLQAHQALTRSEIPLFDEALPAGLEFLGG